MTILILFYLFLQNCPVRHVAYFPKSHHIYETISFYKKGFMLQNYIQIMWANR